MALAEPAPHQPALTLAPGVKAELLRHTAMELPSEACAILSGPDRVTATRLHPARNALASPYRYDLHPEDLVRIVGEIEAAGEVMVAIFHSHPAGAAVPSVTDVREARWDVVHLIADGAGLLRAWMIGGGRAREVALVDG